MGRFTEHVKADHKRLASQPPRSVTVRSLIRGQLRFALGAYEIEHTDKHVVLYVPVGAAGYDRDGIRDGPRGTFLRLDHFARTFSPTSWTGADCLFVHRFGDPWSTWRWVEANRRLRPGAYLNLQEPWRKTRIGWDTADLTLDVVVHPDGVVSYKDEDELKWAEQQGVYRADEAARIRQAGEIARGHATNRNWPLNIDWTRWIPSDQLDLPSPASVWERLCE
jgi:Protein of unknown function (DUF402)